MALGVTPVQIGSDSQGRPFFFEGMADVLPVEDKNGNSLLICSHSSRSHMEGYEGLKYINKSLKLDRNVPSRFFVAEMQQKYRDLIYHMDLAMHVDADGHLYLGENILDPKSEAELLNLLGNERVIYIPENETKLYGLNTVLFDDRFGASKRVAIARIDCPVLRWELHKAGYKVYAQEEVFPHGGGSARCRVASLDLGVPHTLESFLDEQKYVEGRLGASYAIITSDMVDNFRNIYDESHLDEIIHDSNVYEESMNLS